MKWFSRTHLVVFGSKKFLNVFAADTLVGGLPLDVFMTTSEWRYVSCIASMYRQYISYRIIQTIHKPIRSSVNLRPTKVEQIELSTYIMHNMLTTIRDASSLHDNVHETDEMKLKFKMVTLQWKR